MNLGTSKAPVLRSRGFTGLERETVPSRFHRLPVLQIALKERSESYLFPSQRTPHYQDLLSALAPNENRWPALINQDPVTVIVIKHRRSVPFPRGREEREGWGMDCGRNCIIVKGMKGLLKVVLRVGQKGLPIAPPPQLRIKLSGKITTIKRKHNETVLRAGHG
ncbi:hypothetical protein CDAR_501291 [Caerostris darwini]|uniref:Ribosomal protein L2 n=1 Tax=Caerostris darwini TaxID=1538125 RepID=A0AAV4R7B7_9ARAC|nr:hypothetical protein CDAR_501291 [Caerostris darwini]